MKKYILLLALLIILSGTACAADITNPGIIPSRAVFTISNGDTLTLANDDFTAESLSIETGGSLIIESGGSLILAHSSTIYNLGTIDNSGTMEGSFGQIFNNGTLNNFDNISSIDIDNSGAISNSGDIIDIHCVNYGTINNVGGLSITVMRNRGIIYNSGMFVNNGFSMENYGTIFNSETMYNMNGHNVNYGNIDNSGTITCVMASWIKNYGTLDNSGSITLSMDDLIDNFGILDNSGTISSQFGHINNEGIINNFGTLSGDEYYEGGIYFIDNIGTINNCTTGIISGFITGNPVKTVTCPGENVPVTSISVAGQGDVTVIENGKTLQMIATVMPTAATNKDVTWSVVAGTGTATISQTGLLTGTKAGTVTVKATAKDSSGVQGSLAVTVTEIPPTVIPVTGVELSAASTTVEVGKTLQMIATVMPTTATNKGVTWSVTSGTGTATITQTGLLTGTKAGTLTVKATATDGSGIEGSLVVTINAVIVPVTSISVAGQGDVTVIENGRTLQMTATVNPAAATNKDVTWSVVAGTGTATITETGLLTGTKSGTVTVKAIAKDGSGTEGSILITIVEEIVQLTSITVTGAATSVENGKTLQMTATVMPATATNKNVKWSIVAGTGNATITQTGLLTGTKEGNVTIKAMAKDGSGVQGSSVITITATKIVSSGSGGGGGGSGGSGSSGEKTQNIALKDVSSIFVGKGSVKFDFKDPDNDIQYIEYTSLKNSGTITATVEVLKGRSTFAASSPKGVIYRHINIWLGKTGYVTETNLESPVIGFKVDRSWIEDEGIDPASVVLNRYSGDKWTVLSTTQTEPDEKYYYYQAETPGFSPFAITGERLQNEKALLSTNGDEINEHVSFVDLNGTEAQAEKNLPGLSFTVTLLIVSIACFLKRKQ